MVTLLEPVEHSTHSDHEAHGDHEAHDDHAHGDHVVNLKTCQASIVEHCKYSMERPVAKLSPSLA